MKFRIKGDPVGDLTYELSLRQRTDGNVELRIDNGRYKTNLVVVRRAGYLVINGGNVFEEMGFELGAGRQIKVKTYGGREMVGEPLHD